MAQQDFRKPVKRNALSEYKLRLNAPIENGAKTPPTLAIAVSKNQPRLIVYTNVPNDKDNGRISANMDSLTFFALLAQLEEIAINGKPGDRSVFENHGHTFSAGQRSKEMKLISKTVIGKDNDGKVFISVLDWSPDRPRIKFVFLTSSYHALVHGDGSKWSPAELSVVYAKSWITLARKLVAEILVNEYEEPPPRDGAGAGGGSGGGGWNNRGGGNSSGGNRSGGNRSGGDTDFTDDEIPL